jgi:FKBP-type peptidyl-prolyl cis-trans isomerase FkpA
MLSAALPAFAQTVAPAAPGVHGADPATGTAAASASTVTASGIGYQSLREGSGAHPTADDVVRVHYRGTLTDGHEFDSSYTRGEPSEFVLGRVIKCWGEGVQLMKVGGKARLTCPPELAYGSRGAGGVIPPNATLVFDIELLDIVKKK